VVAREGVTGGGRGAGLEMVVGSGVRRIRDGGCVCVWGRGSIFLPLAI
jgi:hypothetical protein